MKEAIDGIGEVIESLQETIQELEDEVPPEIDNVTYPTT